MVVCNVSGAVVVASYGIIASGIGILKLILPPLSSLL
jgi:hypothetical protein